MTNSIRSVRSLRRPLLLAAATAAALALAGCSSPAASPAGGSSGDAGGGEKALRIGFSPFTLQVPALKGLADGLTAAGEAAGDEVLVADPKGDPSTQLQQIQQWVQLGQVDAIWVLPVAGETVAAAITAAQAKGIVVIASGTPQDYGFDGLQAGITFTNVDNEDYGTQIGSLAAQCIEERLDGAGQVVYLQSPSGQQSSGAVNDAIRSALSEGSPDTEIVNSQDAADRLGSQQIISSALQGSPDANTFIGTDDESTLGALDALAASGKDPAQLCVVGAGGNDEVQQAVKDGKVYADIAFDFQADLGQNLEEMHKLAADPTAVGRQIVTPIQTITQ